MESEDMSITSTVLQTHSMLVHIGPLMEESTIGSIAIGTGLTFLAPDFHNLRWILDLQQDPSRERGE